MARQMSTVLLRPGMILGRSLYDAQGRVLLQRGLVIQEQYIKRIRSMYASIYIEDEFSAGIDLVEAIPVEVRLVMQQTLSRQWEYWERNVSFERLTLQPGFARGLREQMKTLLQIVFATTVIQEDLAALASFDNGTYVHSMNVAIYAMMLGHALQLPDSLLIDLGIGAMLHDIGKLWVPSDVINKQGPLTAAETKVMQRHAEWGHHVLSRQTELSYLVAHCAYQHHERLNGSGYPRGLTGDETHQFGKILAVVDVYDAMVMHRPYRLGFPPAEVMEYLFSRAATEFDLDLVSLFSQKVAMYPLGTTVVLSDRTNGLVVRIHDNVPSRPVVLIVKGPDGEPVEPREVDLCQQLNLTITRTHASVIIESID